MIAAVQGTAIAAGCQLVATCDLAVAASSAASPRRACGSGCSAPRRWSRSAGRSAASARWRCCSPASHRRRDRRGLGAGQRGRPAGRARRPGARARRAIAGASPLTVRIGKRAFYRQVDLTQEQAYETAQVMAMNAVAYDAQEGIRRSSRSAAGLAGPLTLSVAAPAGPRRRSTPPGRRRSARRVGGSPWTSTSHADGSRSAASCRALTNMSGGGVVVAHARVQLGRLVRHDQQGASGRDGGSQVGVHPPPQRAREVQELGTDQIERLVTRLPRPEVGLLPTDPVRDVGRRVRGTPPQGHGRDVQCGDPPAAGREPVRVAALPRNRRPGPCRARGQRPRRQAACSARRSTAAPQCRNARPRTPR